MDRLISCLRPRWRVYLALYKGQVIQWSITLKGEATMPDKVPGKTGKKPATKTKKDKKDAKAKKDAKST